jgi:hypothetical protein
VVTLGRNDPSKWLPILQNCSPAYKMVRQPTKYHFVG